MRLLSLAVVAGLFAAGFAVAADEKPVKKPAEGDKKPAEGDKPAAKKMGRTAGVLAKIDGDKLSVTVKGDAGERTDVFTLTEKTKYFAQKPAAPAKDAPKEGDKKPAPMRTPISKEDLKVGGRVAVVAGEDKVAAQVVMLPTPAKKTDKKPDAPKETDKKPVEKK